MDPRVAAQRDHAAAAAVLHVVDGMVVGLGSGDTASHAIRMLGERRLAITAVATSEAAATLGRAVGLDVRAHETVAAIDLTIDGADEIDAALRLIKGGGGAHTREKLVAHASKQLIIIADAHKRVRRLGERGRLPVEILPFGRRWTLERLAALGLDPRPRLGIVTDNGNLIADCALGPVDDLADLGARIKALPGVVEHGLFLDEATLAYIGTDAGVERLTR